MSWKLDEWNILNTKAIDFVSKYKKEKKVYICTKEIDSNYDFIKRRLDLVNIENEYIKIDNININKHKLILTDNSVEQCLKDKGYVEGRNVFVAHRTLRNDFFGQEFPLICNSLFNKTYAHTIQISLTSRCILKCKDCCNGCNYWDKKDKSNDLSWEDTKETIDNVFKNIDYIGSFIFVGGEPLLCQTTLRRSIEYINQNYKNNIDEIMIYTNFSVPILEETLKTLKENRDNIRIVAANYSRAVPKVSKIFFKNSMICSINNIVFDIAYLGNEQWIKYDLFDTINDDNSTNNIAKSCYKHFYSRSPIIHKAKIYFCCQGYLHMINRKMDMKNIQSMDISLFKKEHIYALKYMKGLNEDRDLYPCKHCKGVSCYVAPALQ